MSLELKINKELGSINATAYTCVSLAGIVNEILKDSDVVPFFNAMMGHLCAAYDGVCRSLDPVVSLRDQNVFSQCFENIQSDYQKNFLSAASQPRRHAENSHECYLELVAFPQVKTSYPLLKQAFASLYTLMDKWITNDAWMVMSADGVFKTTNRWLLEVSQLKKQDPEEAWLVYSLGVIGFRQNLAALKSSCATLAQYNTADALDRPLADSARC